MWMDAYVQEILIRQQIADSNRAAEVRHLLHAARSARPARPRSAIVRRLAASWRRRPAERMAASTISGVAASLVLAATLVGPPVEDGNYTVFVGGTPAAAAPSEAVLAFTVSCCWSRRARP
jgi:hypothetical protein